MIIIHFKGLQFSNNIVLSFKIEVLPLPSKSLVFSLSVYTCGRNNYRSTSPCQTCLSRLHGICRSDHPFLSISPILLCISSLFMLNLVMMKSSLYRSGFSFPKISFPLLYHYICRSKFCVGQKIKQYECQTK